MLLKRTLLASVITLASAGLLSACDGSSSSTSSAGTGTFSLNITDGPVDSAAKVVVEFTGVSIKPANGEAMVFNFDEPKSIDLLQLQGSASDSLVSGEVVASGAYEWIRLHVNAEGDGVMDSYMEMDDGTLVELGIPSGAQTGLKLVNGFTVAAGGGADFTIDFDLRKSITAPPGRPNAILKPALRLVDNMVVGSINGTIDGSLVAQECADATVNDGSVYVYSGLDATPTDLQGTSSDPIATALVKYTDDAYSYEVGFLAEGDYTVAYTCSADIDDPATADDVVFSGSSSVTVSAFTAAEAHFAIAVETEIVVETDGTETAE